MNTKIGIQATYWIQGNETQDDNGQPSNSSVFTFGPSSTSTNVITTPIRIGLPEDCPYPPPKPQAGDEKYSGLHDSGPLPPPKEGGDMAILLHCVQQAKQLNDQFLTEQMSLAKKKQGDNDMHPTKRAKVENKESEYFPENLY